MQPIPISAAKHIAKEYDYDQVVIIARKVGEGEHVTLMVWMNQIAVLLLELVISSNTKL